MADLDEIKDILTTIAIKLGVLEKKVKNLEQYNVTNLTYLNHDFIDGAGRNIGCRSLMSQEELTTLWKANDDGVDYDKSE